MSATKFYLNYVGFKHNGLFFSHQTVGGFIWTMWDLNLLLTPERKKKVSFYLNYVGFKQAGKIGLALAQESFIWTMWDLNYTGTVSESGKFQVLSELCGI